MVKDGYAGCPRGASGSSRRAIPSPTSAAPPPRGAIPISGRAAEADDLVLVLVSGGGSALTPAPAPPITLAEKQALTRLLLGAGATIDSSTRCASTARCSRGASSPAPPRPRASHALLLSDVIGDPLDVIASGPTAPDESTYAEALAILDRFGIADRVAPVDPASGSRRGRRGEIAGDAQAGRSRSSTRVTNTVIGNNHLVIDAAMERARALGLTPHLLTRTLEGEAQGSRRPIRGHGARRPRGHAARCGLRAASSRAGRPR